MSLVEDIASTTRPDLAVVSSVIQALDQNAQEETALSLLRGIVLSRGGPSTVSLAEIVQWCEATIESSLAVAFLKNVSTSEVPNDAWLRACAIILAARSIAVGGSIASDLVIEPVDVVPLGTSLESYWIELRRRFPHEWLYHPRKVDLSAFVRQKFVSDLANVSEAFRVLAQAGKIACDLNVPLTAGGRNKTLDFVIGQPARPIGPAPDAGQPLRKAKLALPLLSVEIKACMTAHRQATTRLVDELTSSLDVAKGANPDLIAVALVIVNVSEKYTNPLRLPGPNSHSSRDIQRLFRRLRERVPLDRGSGRERAYGAFAIDVVSIDNESLVETADPSKFVPDSHSYRTCVARAQALFERLQRR